MLMHYRETISSQCMEVVKQGTSLQTVSAAVAWHHTVRYGTSSGNGEVTRRLFCVPAQAGLDSLGAVELRSAVSSAFGIPVPASVAFDYPTQDALAAYIVSELAARAMTAKPSDDITVPAQRQTGKTTDIVSVACQYPAAEATGRPLPHATLSNRIDACLGGCCCRHQLLTG